MKLFKNILELLLPSRIEKKTEEENSLMKYLIVGLGNIGPEYTGTRHNIGFRIVDTLAESAGVQWEDKRYGFIARMRVKNAQLILLKPSTFMNLSGNAVRYWMQQEKIELQNQLYYYQDEEFIYDYYFTPIQMYITDNNLILMYEKVIQKNYNNLFRSYWCGFYGNAFETVLQIYDKDEFNLTKEISVPGSLIDGRVYNDYIYFITAENIVDYKIASVVETTNGVEDEKEFDYDDVIYVPEYIDYPYENYICSITKVIISYFRKKENIFKYHIICAHSSLI